VDLAPDFNLPVRDHGAAGERSFKSHLAEDAPGAQVVSITALPPPLFVRLGPSRSEEERSCGGAFRDQDLPFANAIFLYFDATGSSRHRF